MSADFWDNVATGPTHTCWYWIGTVNSAGYGVCDHDGRRMLAHRVAHELAVGPIGRGLVIMHSCDNRRCCNPHHLQAGTTRDNARDRADKHRGHGQRRRPPGRRYW